jgi:glutathione synthase
MRICFLIANGRPWIETENRFYLANAALTLGYEVSFGFIDGLACHDLDLSAPCARVHAVLTMGVEPTLAFAPTPLAEFNFIWILSVGRFATFLDKIQMLKRLAAESRIVNSPEALLFEHSKISQSDLGGAIRYPETHISADFESLWSIVRAGGDWIVKPVASSLGRNVFRLRKGDSNIRVILQAMTGHDGSQYCLVQRYIAEVEHGEKRVLLAGGQIIGCYAKKATIDHRGNLNQEGEARLCSLTAAETETCLQIGKYLLERQVYFAGLDIAGTWLLEWNVLNPGGIGTIHRLGGGNRAAEAVENVIAAAAHV